MRGNQGMRSEADGASLPARRRLLLGAVVLGILAAVGLSAPLRQAPTQVSAAVATPRLPRAAQPTSTLLQHAGLQAESALTTTVFLPLVASADLNLPPEIPGHPSPEDGATGVNVATDLNWTGGDPDGDVVTYRVYLQADTLRPTTLLTEVMASAAAPGPLTAGSDYTWQVVATDARGARVEGPVWHFTTAPAACDEACQVVVLTNKERAAGGCPPLEVSPQLAAAALAHSEDMALNDFFSHTGLDGTTFVDRIEATGYDWWAVAENIAAGYPTPERVVAGWMASPGHRANILNCELTEIGVGYYFLENDTGAETYRHYWTQDFATPR